MGKLSDLVVEIALTGDEHVAVIDCADYASIGVQVVEAGGSTLTNIFEGSQDKGATWLTVNATPTGAGASATPVSTGTGNFRFDSAAYNRFRVRISSYTSGSQDVTLSPSAGQATSTVSAEIDATGLATSTLQGTINTSIGTGNTALAAANTARGAAADAAATTDTGTFSVIALIKRGLQNWTTLLAKIATLTNGAYPVTDSLNLSGNSRVDIALTTSPDQSAALAAGRYAIYTSADCYIKVHATANNVTVAAGANAGLLFKAGVTEILTVPANEKIGGVVSTGTATLSYHKV
jgi:hypothetical protein